MFRRQHKALGANPKKKNEQDSLSKTSSNLSPVSVLDDQLESVPCNEETQLPILTPKRATSYEIQQDTQLPSLVIVSDAGAEVTLENHVKKALRTPSKSKRKESILTTPTSRHRSCKNLPTNSLFDDEEQLSTPSPSPQKKGSIFFCNGASSCYRPDNTSLSITTKKPYEHTICTMLGSPVGVNDWCSGWQAWTYYEINVPTDHQMGLKEDVRRVLRNRVTNTNSRFKHIRTLKRDLHPFDRTPEKARVQLSKTLSFPAQTVLPHNKNTSIPSNNDAPFVIRTRGLDTSDGFYDSDPEESTKRRSRRRCKSSRLPNDFKQPTSPLRTVDFCDEEGVKQVVQEIINARFTWVLHPDREKVNQENATPVAVSAWVERGQQLSTKLIQPRLAWSSSMAAKESVELLDIVRVLEVNHVDRRRYPLAPRRKSFLVECLNRRMVFQASTERERDRLVHGLKIVIARLGSKIITEDEDVFSEFFLPPEQSKVQWTR